MTTSGSSGSLADVLLCPVCNEQINTPKIIPCGHSFCLEPCLRDLLKTSHACPLCRQDIQAPPSGLADDFPTNFALHAMVSTKVTSTTEESNTLRSCTSDDSETDCELHQRRGEYFCGTCLKFLCEECNSTHKSGHKIERLNTILERSIGALEPMMGEISNSLKIIGERMESVKDARVKCGESCQQAELEIRNAVSSFTDLIQEEGNKLVIEVTQGREAGINALNQVEVQLGDVRGTAERTEELAASLMTRIRRKDIRDTGMFDVLKTQQKKINKELANIRGPPDETVLVKFQSKSMPGISLGKVTVVTEAGNKPNQPTGFSFGNMAAPSTGGIPLGTPATSQGAVGFLNNRSSFSFGNMAAPSTGGIPLGTPATSQGAVGFLNNRSTFGAGTSGGPFVYPMPGRSRSLFG